MSVIEILGDRAPQGTSIRFAVKEATAAAHERLDQGLGHLDLAQADGYRRFLKTIAAAHLPLEALLERSGIARIITDWSQRSRSSALRRDMEALGEQPEPLDLDIDTVNQAFALGILYTLEGSRLGGRYLLQTVQHSHAHLPVEFLQHGDTRLWGRFCAQLEASPEAHAHLDDVIAGARTAFSIFERAMERTTRKFLHGNSYT